MAIFAAVVVAAAAVLLPVAWMVLTAFRPNADVVKHSTELFAGHVTLDNFEQIFQDIPFGRELLNTLVFAGGVTILSLTFDSMTAYALARLEFPGRRWLFVAVLLLLMIPFQVTLIPIYQLMSHFHLINTFPGLIVPRATNAFGIFFLRQAFLSIPKQLDEACRIDGASEFRIFSRIIVPLSKPALLTLALFHFMYNWNDLLWPLIFATSQSMYTLPAGLALFTGQHQVQYGLLMAGATLSMLPLLVAFLFIQRRFVEGIATTGLRS
jgi:multiple sugar transport system permease protein